MSSMAVVAKKLFRSPIRHGGPSRSALAGRADPEHLEVMVLHQKTGFDIDQFMEGTKAQAVDQFHLAADPTDQGMAVPAMASDVGVLTIGPMHPFEKTQFDQFANRPVHRGGADPFTFEQCHRLGNRPATGLLVEQFPNPLPLRGMAFADGVEGPAHGGFNSRSSHCRNRGKRWRVITDLPGKPAPPNRPLSPAEQPPDR